MRPGGAVGVCLDVRDGEAGRFHFGGQEVDWPVVRRGDRVFEWFQLRASEEAECEATARVDAPRKFGERGTDLLGGGMDKRVPGEYPAERSVIDAEGFGFTDPVAHAGIGFSRILDELRNWVDALGVDSEAHEVVRPLARAASHVEHRPLDVARPSFYECQVRRGCMLNAPECFDVLGCPIAVGGSDGFNTIGHEHHFLAGS